MASQRTRLPQNDTYYHRTISPYGDSKGYANATEHPLLARQRLHGNQAVLQRFKNPLGGENTSALALDRQVGKRTQTVMPGDDGYAEAMLRTVPQVAGSGALANMGEMMKFTEALQPYFGKVDTQIRQWSTDAANLKEQAEKGGVDFGRFDFAAANLTTAQKWLSDQSAAAEASKTNQLLRWEQHNTWRARANGFIGSAVRLQAMQDMIGVGNLEELAGTLQTGIAEAGQVATLGKLKDLDLPAPDDSLGETVAMLPIQSEKMINAWLSWRAEVDLPAFAESITKEGTDEQARLREIEANRKTLKEIGEVIDLSMAAIKGAPAVAGAVRGVVDGGEAYIRTGKNIAKRETSYEAIADAHYIAQGEDGSMVMHHPGRGSSIDLATGESAGDGNVTYQGYVGTVGNAAKAGAELALDGFAPEYKIPTDVATLMENLGTYMYADEIKKLNLALGKIAFRADAVKDSALKAKIQATTRMLQTAINEYVVFAEQLQKRLAARRNAYLEFGQSLDAVLQESREAKSQGLALGKKQEKFALIMTVLGQVREVVTLGKGAFPATSPSDPGLPGSAALGNEYDALVSERQKYPPDIGSLGTLSRGRITSPESAFWEKMISDTATFENIYGAVDKVLGPVDTAATRMISSTSAGGGKGEY